jgi:cytochrome P450
MNRRLEGFQDYIYEHVTAKRADPQDDMISFLCDVHYEALDRKLTNIEIAGIVHAMILGGLETTQYALEEQAHCCASTPSVPGAARRPVEGRAFVEEVTALRPPRTGSSTRMTTRTRSSRGCRFLRGRCCTSASPPRT